MLVILHPEQTKPTKKTIMKTTVKFFAILFALSMMVCNVYAEPKGKPVTVKTSKDTPKVSGNIGPRRAKAQVTTLDIDIYLDLTERCLNFCDTEGRNITYNIYNEDDFLVANGTISFAVEEEASVSLANLPDGIYTLSIECNGKTYEGEFGLEE